MGYGQVPDQAVAAQHRGHHQQAGRPDRRRSQDQVHRLQQSQEQPPEHGEETNVSTQCLRLNDLQLR